MTDQMNMNINMTMLEDIACDQCGNHTFSSVFLLKKVPMTLSPTGKAGIFPVPAFACNACGNINNGMVPRVSEDSIKEAKEAAEQESKPKLVLS